MNRRVFASDEGFTLVEVIIAAFIMFFVLTAIVGLMGVSSNMAVQARQRSVMTNAVASYLDDLRAIDWETIDTPPGPVSIVRDGVTVTMIVAVETRQADGQDYIKIVRVTASSEMNGNSQRYETSVAIMKNPNFNRALSTNPDAPTVYWMPDAPPDDSVLYLNQRLAGGTIYLKVKAFSPNDLIQEVRYDVANRTVFQSSSGNPAIFTPSPMVQTYYAGPTWWTTQEGVLDGFGTVAVTVTDDKQRSSVLRRRFIIDNQGPQSPGVPVVAGASSTELNLQWAAAKDGGTEAAPYYASKYDYRIWREPKDGAALGSWEQLPDGSLTAGATTALAITNAGPITQNVSVANGTLAAFDRVRPPFSRYRAEVKASSPRGLTNGAFVPSAAAGVTRPELLCDPETSDSIYRSTGQTRFSNAGSAATRFNEYALVFWVGKPMFPHTGTPAYTIQYQVAGTTPPSPTAWQPLGVTPVVDLSDPNAVKLTATRRFTGSGVAQRLWFRVGVSGIAPSGAGGGGPTASDTMWTNAAGVTSITHLETVFLLPSWEF